MGGSVEWRWILQYAHLGLDIVAKKIDVGAEVTWTILYVH